MKSRKANHTESAAPNWRPWQLSPLFLILLILVAVGITVTLEVLVQRGNSPFGSSQLRTELLDWYCNGTNDCFSTTDFPFYNASESKKGLLTFVTPDSVSGSSTFFWLYFPTILAVLYAIFWQVVDDEVKRIEPFYQMSRERGTSVESTLFATYISIPPILAPFQALRWRQMAALFSSFTYVMVGFVTPILQSQLFQLQTQFLQLGYIDSWSGGLEPFKRDHSGYNPEDADGPIIGVFSDDLSGIVWWDAADLMNQGFFRNVVYIDPLFARIQEGILLAAAVFGVLLLWITWSRISGLQSATKGWAAIASLGAAYDDFLEDISQLIESESPLNEGAELQKRIVHLGRKRRDGYSPYGFWLEPAGPGSDKTRSRQWGRELKSHLRRFANMFFGNYFGHHAALRVALGLSILGNLWLIIMILVTGGTEKPDSSQDVALDKTIRGSQNNIILSAVELIIVAVVKTLWVVVEEQTIALTPFRALHRQPVKAWPILGRDYAAISPVLRTIRALQDRQYILGFVTAIALLLELGLTCFGITASMSQGQAYNADAIWIIHWIAFTVSIIIILFIASSGRVFLAGFPPLKQDPDTIGARLSYVTRSTLFLRDTAPMANMGDAEKSTYLRQLDGLYRFGPLQCRSRMGNTIIVEGIERSERLLQDHTRQPLSPTMEAGPYHRRTTYN